MVFDKRFSLFGDDAGWMLRWQEGGRLNMEFDTAENTLHKALGELNRQKAQINRLTAGVQRIADGYGGDVASFAQNLLEGKV